jgi:hypothetical protein
MNPKLLAQIYNPVIGKELGGENLAGNVALALLIARLFRAVMVVGGLALLLYLGWGGINWITSGADKGKVEDAQHKITNSIIGMAFLVATVAIVALLGWAFGFDLLNPSLPPELLPAEAK